MTKVAVISDIHANVFALEAVLEELDKQSIGQVFVCGDLVGYYYWPGEVVQYLMNNSRFRCIAGNHEKILEKCSASPSDAVRYRKKYGSGYDVCLDQLSSAQLSWLFSLPDSLVVEVGSHSFYLGHGSLCSVEEYIYPNSPQELIRRNYSDKDFTLFGHTHYPFFHSFGGRYLLNPGSVGQPRDVGGLASYMTIDLASGAVKPARVRFDVQQVIAAAKELDPGNEYLWKIMSR